MNETGLIAFQLEQTLEAIKYVLCGIALFVGIGLFVHATYFRKKDEEEK